MSPPRSGGTVPIPRKRKTPRGQELPPPQTDSGGHGCDMATRLRPKLSNLPFLTNLPFPPEPPGQRCQIKHRMAS